MRVTICRAIPLEDASVTVSMVVGVQMRFLLHCSQQFLALLCRRDWPTVTAAFGGEADIDRVRRLSGHYPGVPKSLTALETRGSRIRRNP
jgi:hypothetical protein